MTKPIGEKGKGFEKKEVEKTEGFFLGRLFRWLFSLPAPLTPEEKKAAKIKQQKANVEYLRKKEIDFQAKEAQSQKAKVEHNYALILKLSDRKDLTFLKVEKGQLVKMKKPTRKQDQLAAKELIKQTQRQAWGRLIDA